MDLLFDFGATPDRRVSVIGTMSRAHTFVTTGLVDYFGIRFRPGGLAGFVALDAAELADERADLTCFWGRRAHEIWHRLAELTAVDRVALLRDILGARGPALLDPFVRHCVARMEASRGALRIAALESSTGLSARQLERKFARHLGVSLKAFARIVRFKGVVAAAEAGRGPPDWARLAQDFGFADQSHLVREFKALSGLSPTRFMENPEEPAAHVGFLQDA